MQIIRLSASSLGQNVNKFIFWILARRGNFTKNIFNLFSSRRRFFCWNFYLDPQRSFCSKKHTAIYAALQLFPKEKGAVRRTGASSKKWKSYVSAAALRATSFCSAEPVIQGSTHPDFGNSTPPRFIPPVSTTAVIKTGAWKYSLVSARFRCPARLYRAVLCPASAQCVHTR